MKRAAVVVLGVIAIVCLLAQYRVRSEGLGSKLHAQVVNGFETRGYWPWFVSLEISRPDGIHICGGVLIRTDVVLTAAHCVQDAKSISCYVGNDNVSPKPKGTRAVYWEQHPGYKTNKENADFALVFLGDIPTKNYPIQLAAYYPPKGTPLTTMGYGLTGTPFDGVPSMTLQAFFTNQWTVTGDNTISLNRNKVSAGSGDSGGPCIYFEGKTKDYKSARLLGISSQVWQYTYDRKATYETKHGSVLYQKKWILSRLAACRIVVYPGHGGRGYQVPARRVTRCD
jgi:secreted trypsin-like serine protease